MDIGKKNHNTKYYDGFEGESEVNIFLENETIYHIWNGYLCDIFSEPTLNDKIWTGFTRDFQEMIGAFSDTKYFISEPIEYQADLLLYKNKKFEFEETYEIFSLISKLLEQSIQNNKKLIFISGL